jgi:hypothetical protein
MRNEVILKPVKFEQKQTQAFIYNAWVSTHRIGIIYAMNNIFAANYYFPANGKIDEWLNFNSLDDAKAYIVGRWKEFTDNISMPPMQANW